MPALALVPADAVPPRAEQRVLRPVIAFVRELVAPPSRVRRRCRQLRPPLRVALRHHHETVPAEPSSPLDLLAYRPKRHAPGLLVILPPAPPPVEDLPREPLPNTGSRVIRRLRLNRVERAQLRADEEWIREAGIERPEPHADCDDEPGPCLWVSCRQNLYLDVNPRNGSIKLNFPHLEPWEMEESCAIRVAKRGEQSLEKIGGFLNVSMERARQVLNGILPKYKANAPRPEEDEET